MTTIISSLVGGKFPNWYDAHTHVHIRTHCRNKVECNWITLTLPQRYC